MVSMGMADGTPGVPSLPMQNHMTPPPGPPPPHPQNMGLPTDYMAMNGGHPGPGQMPHTAWPPRLPPPHMPPPPPPRQPPMMVQNGVYCTPPPLPPHCQNRNGGGGGGGGGGGPSGGGGGAGGNTYARMRYYAPGPRGYNPMQSQMSQGQHSYYNQGRFQRKPRMPWRNSAARQQYYNAGADMMAYMQQQQQQTSQWSNNYSGGPIPEATQVSQPVHERPEQKQPPKKKKKTISVVSSRPWNKEAAEQALALELECQKTCSIIVRFPDPELSRDMVLNFHPAIDSVHFQSPCGKRYCFITLKEEANADKVIREINKIPFGGGHLKAERKCPKVEETVNPENIDPYTLYVGNLPANITTTEVKEKFPTACRIDIGYAQKLKFTRYAFVRYDKFEYAREAYKASINSIIASRSIILRFRRHKAPVGPPGVHPSPSIIDVKPGEKPTVGAKLKAKKEKAEKERASMVKQEVDKQPKEKARSKIEESKAVGDDSSDDEEIELENDDKESDDEEEGNDEEDDDDDKDDGTGDVDEESDDDDHTEITGVQNYDDDPDDEENIFISWTRDTDPHDGSEADDEHVEFGNF